MRRLRRKRRVRTRALVETPCLIRDVKKNDGVDGRCRGSDIAAAWAAGCPHWLARLHTPVGGKGGRALVVRPPWLPTACVRAVA